ncbi:hypothetical protein AB0F91_41390 [Amycolatopsis sp. NPDC023774]|uniref:hypothetical protein n=1 Tax=Amycolatopsis sp. NPDC023774 TaxID=3155015 RepID=UPI0034004703
MEERRSGAWNAAAEQARAELATDSAGIAHATGDLLLVLAHVTDPTGRSPLDTTAAEFERAARRPAIWSRAALDLRTAASPLARARPSRVTSAAAVLALLLAVAALVTELAAWRAQRNQVAAAADRARQALACHVTQFAERHPGQPAAATSPNDRHGGHLAERQPRARVHRPTTIGTPARPGRRRRSPSPAGTMPLAEPPARAEPPPARAGVSIPHTRGTSTGRAVCGRQRARRAPEARRARRPAATC